MIRISGHTEIERFPSIGASSGSLRREIWWGFSLKKRIVSSIVSWVSWGSVQNALLNESLYVIFILPCHQRSQKWLIFFTSNKWSRYIDSLLGIFDHIIEIRIISDSSRIIHLYWLPCMLHLCECHSDKCGEINTRVMCIVASPFFEIWIEAYSSSDFIFSFCRGDSIHIRNYIICLL